MKNDFDTLISTLQPSIFSRDYFSNFNKIKENSFKIKVQLNILNSLLGEKDIENKFIRLVTDYPDTRKVLPILIATRKSKIAGFPILVDKEMLISKYQWDLFDTKKSLVLEDALIFFRETWLKDLFENKYITNLEDYVFGIETWMDTNGRKKRTWDLMENLTEKFIKDLCDRNKALEYKQQATKKFIKEKWWINVQSDKSSRRFDFAIFDKDNNKIFIIEVNYYWAWGTKLKAVAGEFSWLYDFMQNQNITFFWITDWLWWNTAKRALEEAYSKMDWNIYNIAMLNDWILNEIIE